LILGKIWNNLLSYKFLATRHEGTKKSLRLLLKMIFKELYNNLGALSGATWLEHYIGTVILRVYNPYNSALACQVWARDLVSLWLNYYLLSSLSVFLLTLLLGCASLSTLPPAKPFSQQDTNRLISNLQDQGEKVSSFQGVGKLHLKKGEEEIEANLFAIGSNPYKIRLEITHSWGKPLLYIVADEKSISVLSLTDKKFFRGPPHSLDIKQFFLYGLDLDLAWKIFSGSVPILSGSGRTVSLKPHEISLYNKQGEIMETISFSSKTLLPRSICFPKKGFSILYSEFEEGDLGPHPLKIKVLKENEDQLIVIRYKSLTLNKPVPEEIFELNPPSNFEIVNPNNS